MDITEIFLRLNFESLPIMYITMLKGQSEYNRAFLIRAACEGLLKGREVAERLKISIGRVDQLKRKFRQVGDLAFIHGNKGRTPANKIPETIRKTIIETKLTDIYVKANFTHFTEILREMGINHSYWTIRNILREAGHKSPKSRRPKKQRPVHPPRPRRESFGEMLQADGSPFDWFGDGKKSTLHGFVDDATGTITGLYLERNECLLGYLEVARQTIERYGIPAELYPDKASVFFATQKERENLTVEEQLDGITERHTQLGTIMEELGVDMHPAHSPQAKGRIERLWETLQSRLPVEFRRRGISTITAANNFLIHEYIGLFNKEFSIAPASNNSRFVRLYDTSILDTLLVCRIQRKTDNTGIFQFHNHKFIVSDPACRGRKIDIVMSEKIGFKAMLKRHGTLYDIQLCNCYSNKQKSHIPNVTLSLIARYLKSGTKETTRNEQFMRVW